MGLIKISNFVQLPVRTRAKISLRNYLWLVDDFYCCNRKANAKSLSYVYDLCGNRHTLHLKKTSAPFTQADQSGLPVSFLGGPDRTVDTRRHTIC